MPLPRYEANEGLSKEELLALVEARKVQRVGFPAGGPDSNEGNPISGPVALTSEDTPERPNDFLQSGSTTDTRPGQGGVTGTEASGGGMSGAGNENPNGPATGTSPAPAYDPWNHPAIAKYKNVPLDQRPIGVYPDGIVQGAPPSIDGMPDPTGQRFAPDGRPIVWIKGGSSGLASAGGSTNAGSTATGTEASGGGLAGAGNEGGVVGGSGGGTAATGSTGSTGAGTGVKTVVPVVDPIVATEKSIKDAQDLLDSFTAGTLDINGFIKNFGALLGQGEDGMKELGIGGQPAGGLPIDWASILNGASNFDKLSKYINDHNGRLPIRYIEPTEGVPANSGGFGGTEGDPGGWTFVDPFTGLVVTDLAGDRLDASGAAAQWEIEKGIFDSFVELQQYAAKGQLDAQYQAALQVLADKLQSGRDLLAFTRNQELQKQGEDAAAGRQDDQQDFIAGESALDRAARLAEQNDQQSFLSSEAEKDRLARDREAAEQRQWESNMAKLKFDWDKELQGLNLEYQKSRDAMTNAISQGNLDLARQQFENSKLYEAKQIELKSRESTLSILATLGQYPHLRGALIASGLLEGANLGGANLGSVFGQAIPTGALPSLTVLTQMPASQREATLNDLAGQYGVPVDQIVQMIQRNAPGSTGRLR